jgi:asparagine synthase (glutamine-hydrolysing)
MPLRTERGDVVLFFSGEEFPEPGTASHLKQKGHEFDDSGAAYLVHLYEEDPSFPAALNGRFHGILIDRNRKSAFLFNDRYGMHRVYYHESTDGFYFAAEAKAILAVVTETRELNFRAVGEFVACGCALEGRTLFEGVRVLPGGSKWVLRDGLIIEKQTYFKPEQWENQESLDIEPYYRELRNVFCQNLPRYFKGQGRIAMSLTGGLDTRMIMAWQRCSPGSLPCYTFGGEIRDCQDVIQGRRIADICGQPHEVIRVGREFLGQFAHYAERTVWLTDGCVDVSRSPDLYLNERARQIAAVRMSGVYGGELLRRVLAFKPGNVRLELFASDFQGYLQHAKETYASNIPQNPVSFALFKQAPWAQYGILALEQTQVQLRTPFLDNDLVRTVFRAPKPTLDSNTLCRRLIAEGNSALLGVPTDRGLYLNARRSPLPAAHLTLEFLFKAEYAYDLGMPQWLASIDHAFSPFHLERLFLGRHKLFHFRIWYRDALAKYVQETLLDSSSLSRSYLRRKEVESIVRGHVRGDRNFTSEIHSLLTLELVQRTLLQPMYRDNSSQSWLPEASSVAS